MPNPPPTWGPRSQSEVALRLSEYQEPRTSSLNLSIVWMRAPILAPAVAMHLCPRSLRPSLVLAVVGIALPLGLLPASPSRALTGRGTAVHLMRDL
jgi:hypothetical protein